MLDRLPQSMPALAVIYGVARGLPLPVAGVRLIPAYREPQDAVEDALVGPVFDVEVECERLHRKLASLPVEFADRLVRLVQGDPVLLRGVGRKVWRVGEAAAQRR